MARLVMGRPTARVSGFRITFLSLGSTVITEMTLTSPREQVTLRRAFVADSAGRLRSRSFFVGLDRLPTRDDRCIVI